MLQPVDIADFNWNRTPLWLRVALERARYMGGGYSSHVWDLGNGYVVKITQDTVVCQAMGRLLHRPVQGLPKVWYLGCDEVRQGRKKFTVIIQTKYRRIDRAVWRMVKAAMHRADPQFSRDIDRYNSRGRLACRQLRMLRRKVALSRSHPLREMQAALRRVHTWLHAKRGWSLDIDHSDNWGQDHQGHLVLIDPVV